MLTLADAVAEMSPHKKEHANVFGYVRETEEGETYLVFLGSIAACYDMYKDVEVQSVESDGRSIILGGIIETYD